MDPRTHNKLAVNITRIVHQLHSANAPETELSFGHHARQLRCNVDSGMRIVATIEAETALVQVSIEDPFVLPPSLIGAH